MLGGVKLQDGWGLRGRDDGDVRAARLDAMKRFIDARLHDPALDAELAERIRAREAYLASLLPPRAPGRGNVGPPVGIDQTTIHGTTGSMSQPVTLDSSETIIPAAIAASTGHNGSSVPGEFVAMGGSLPRSTVTGFRRLPERRLSAM